MAKNVKRYSILLLLVLGVVILVVSSDGSALTDDNLRAIYGGCNRECISEPIPSPGTGCVKSTRSNCEKLLNPTRCWGVIIKGEECDWTWQSWCSGGLAYYQCIDDSSSCQQFYNIYACSNIHNNCKDESPDPVGGLTCGRFDVCNSY